MRVYAQAGINGKVHTIMETENIIIPLGVYDDRVVGTVYNEEKGEFEGYRITLTVDKQQITANGEDTATITATITTWNEQPGNDFDGDIIFEVNGAEIPVTVTNGQAVFEFASNEIGTYEIKTANKEMTILSNDSIEIEVIDNGK